MLLHVLCWFCWMWLVAVVGRCLVGASTVKVIVEKLLKINI